MKQIYLKFSMLLLCLVVGLSSWAEDVTGTINFGSGTGYLNVNSASVSGNDSQNNSWTVTTVGTTSFTPNAGYAQIGASKSPATSITFTTTLPASQTITSFSAKFGGFSGTAGTVTLKVGDTTVGTGSLSGTTEVTVTNTNSATSGTVLTVTVTGISKGVKAYSINYTYEVTGDRQALPAPTNLASSNVTDRSATLSWDAVDNATGYKVKIGTAEYDVTTNSYSATGLTESTAYTWSVRAKGNGSTYDNSSYSSEQQFTTTAFVITAGTYNIVPNNTFWGTTQDGSKNVSENTVFGPVTKYGVSMSMNSNKSTSSYIKSDHTRAYQHYTVELSAPKGFELTQIVFTGSTWSTPKVSIGNIDNKTWTGNAETVTFTFSGTSYMSNIAVTYSNIKTLQSVTVSGTPTKTTYEAGENFAPAGLTVTGTYDDNSTANITEGITWSTPAALTAGQTSVKITATVSGVTSPEFEVTGLTVKAVKTLSSITVTGTPAEFWKGDTFNHTGMTVTATWSEGDPTDVSADATFSTPDMTTAGKKTVTVKYQDKTATYNIEVKTIANTAETAYTVAEAKALIDANRDLSTEVFVKGVVSYVASKTIPEEGGYLNFYITKDGVDDRDNQFEFFNCYDINGNKFTSLDDVKVGANVVGKGKITKYNSTYEFASGCQLVSYEAPTPAEKTETSLAWSAYTASVTINANDNVFPTLTTTPANLEGVTYSSSNTSVATIATDGTITLKSAGTTTITASYTGNDTYEAAENATYTLTVNAAPVDNYTITLKSCGNTIAGGNTSIEVQAGNSTTLPSVTTTATGYTFKGWSTTEQKEETNTCPTLVDNTYSPTADVTLYPIFDKTTGGTQDFAWALVDYNSIDTSEPIVIVVSNESYSRCVTTENGETYLKGDNVTVDNGVITSTILDNYKWTTWTDDSGIGFYSGGKYLNSSNVKSYPYDYWSLESNGTKTYSMKNLGTANGQYLTLSGKAFTMSNTAADSKVQFYQYSIAEVGGSSTYTSYPLGEMLEITLNPACHDADGMVYGTFSSSKAFYVPADVIVAEIGIVDNALYVDEYDEGDLVPANRGLMISAEQGGTYYLPVENDQEMIDECAESKLDSDNCLHPTGDEPITADEMSQADPYCTYYRLTMHNKTQIGYWWGAENGAAFALGANKAYLAVSNSSSVKVQGMWFGDNATSISAPAIENNANDAIYNLNGQRVNTVTKGMYIKNGKKYFVK